MGTHFKGSKKETTALDTYIKFMRAAGSLNSRIKLSLSKSGLTESQFNALDALYHLGPLSQKDLTKKLLKSGGNITMVIDNLEKRGYVKRRRERKDRRFYFVHLTAAGKKQVANFLPSRVNKIMREISSLSEDEQIELQRLCKKLGLNTNSGFIFLNKCR